MGDANRIVLPVLCLILCLTGCSSDKSDQIIAEPLRAIKYAVVGARQGDRVRTLSGRVRARESSQLSFQVPGQVLKVYAEVGDLVNAGDVIALMDDTSYQLRLDTTQAELSGAESALRERRDNFDKQQEVFKDQFISQSQLDQAKASLERAQSSVKLAQSKLDLARRELTQTRLIAPFAGTVTRRTIEPFEEVAAAQAVIELQGTAGYEVAVLVPGKLLSQIARGDAVDISIPTLGLADIRGQVTERALRADNRGAYPVTVVLDNPPQSLQAGMSARVNLKLQSMQDELLLPESAVAVGPQGERYVYRYEASTSTVHRVNVSVAPWDLDQVSVAGELVPGDVVCVAGVEFLREGQEVLLYEANL